MEMMLPVHLIKPGVKLKLNLPNPLPDWLGKYDSDPEVSKAYSESIIWEKT